MDVLNTKIKDILAEKTLKIKSENIKKDVTIFDVTGAYEGIDTSDADATTTDLADGKTAYVNGELITGELNDCRDASFGLGDAAVSSVTYDENQDHSNRLATL